MSVGFSRILYVTELRTAPPPAPPPPPKQGLGAWIRAWWKGASPADEALDQELAREALRLSAALLAREDVWKALEAAGLVEGEDCTALEPAGALRGYCEELGLVEPRVKIDATARELASPYERPGTTVQICPECQAELPRTFGRDPQTGDELELRRFECTACGAELPDDLEARAPRQVRAAFSVELVADSYDTTTPRLRDGCASLVTAVEVVLGRVEERFVAW